MKSAAQPETIVMPAAKFKAQCLRLIDEVNTTRRPITVTKRGKPVGQFIPMPVEKKNFRPLFGRSSGIVIPGAEEWKKIKVEWAKELDESTERLAELIAAPKQKKSGKK